MKVCVHLRMFHWKPIEWISQSIDVICVFIHIYLIHRFSTILSPRFLFSLKSTTLFYWLHPLTPDFREHRFLQVRRNSLTIIKSKYSHFVPLHWRHIIQIAFIIAAGSRHLSSILLLTNWTLQSISKASLWEKLLDFGMSNKNTNTY